MSESGGLYEEIIIFRPSSMPITEVMKEDTTFDEKDWR